jgi:hypothetical protein
LSVFLSHFPKTEKKSVKKVVESSKVTDQENKKIIFIFSPEFFEMFDPSCQVEGHSLTWSRDRQPGSPDANHWTITKIWHPTAEETSRSDLDCDVTEQR